MYKPGPIQPYHFQPVSIWWDSPFKAFEEKIVVLSGYQTQAPCVDGRHLSQRVASQVLSGCNLLKNPHTSPYIVYDSQAYTIKGTVSRDFRLLVFFMNQFPPSIWVYQYGLFEFFRKFAEIFAAQGAPPVSTTPVANGKTLQAEIF